ncbi:MAG: exo-alpha-sialidase [Clostridia bacterium]|nr:exo-alpha-sialidase [Clostridia bacterium]
MFGKIICDLPPTKDNNRNSEGSFIKLKNGNIMFVYSRYGEKGCGDSDKADLYAMISTDDGETFSTPYLSLACSDVGADNVMSVSLMRMKNGNIGMFYCQKHNSSINCIPYLAISEDEGKTWTKHIRCIHEDGYYVLCNDKCVTLDNGRLMIAVSKHEYIVDDFSPGIICIYASDDDGMTWYEITDKIKIDCNITDGMDRGRIYDLTTCEEPGLAQLGDGRVWCYTRTKRGTQYEAFSEDYGKTWTKLLPSKFSSTQAPMTVKKLNNGNMIAVWSPISNYDENIEYGDDIIVAVRCPFVFALLNPDGDFISEYREFETDKNVGYCYPAIFETDGGDILIGYCAGHYKDDESCLNRLRIRKIYKSELC